MKKHNTKQEKEILRGGIFQVDQSNRIEDTTKDSYIAVARDDIGFCFKISTKLKNYLYTAYVERNSKKFYAPELFAKSIKCILEDKKLIPARLLIDIEYPGYEHSITEIIRQYSKEIEIIFNKVGKNSPAHILAYSFGSTKFKHKNKAVIPIEGTKARLHPESTWIRTRTRPK